MTMSSSARIGVVLVGHGQIAPAMVNAARNILGSLDAIVGVAVESNAPVDDNRRLLAEAIASVDQGHGVLLLSDMFGGTPSNLCLSFLKSTVVEVISGFNLPMVIKLAGGLQLKPFAEVMKVLTSYGQKNIVNASDVLEGKIDAGA